MAACLFPDEIGRHGRRDRRQEILRVLQKERSFGSASQPRTSRPRVTPPPSGASIRWFEKAAPSRLDLLHRIAGWEVQLPPLRERPVSCILFGLFTFWPSILSWFLVFTPRVTQKFSRICRMLPCVPCNVSLALSTGQAMCSNCSMKCIRVARGF